MPLRTRATTPIALALALVAGCGEPAERTDRTEETPAADARVQRVGELALVKGERSTPAFPEARLAIDAPRAGVVLPGGTVEVTLDLRGFETGVPTPGADARGIARSPQGQHVHLILDNEPYRAIYETDRVIELADLSPGPHLLRAFPSRQWHESVKSPGAFAMTHFFVRDTANGLRLDPDAPLLTYSRPKGAYEGPDADSVMVDFYLTNATLGEDHSVRLVVDDTIAFELDEWVPYYLVGLEEGEHEIGLQLLGPDGVPVPGEVNATERTITVVR